MGDLGGAEILIILLLFVVPAAVLFRVAKARGATRWWAGLGIFSLLGLAVGLIGIHVSAAPAPAARDDSRF